MSTSKFSIGLLVKTIFQWILDLFSESALSVDLELSSEPYFVGAYDKIGVTSKGISFDELEFVLAEGAPGGYISPCRDAEFDPAHPDIMLCLGYRPGTYHIEARKKADHSLVKTFEYKLDTIWKDDRWGPPLSFHGINAGYAFGASWGGGPANQPQNIDVLPASGTRRAAILLVDSSSQRYTTNATALQAIKNTWLKNFKDGFVGVDGVSRSSRAFFRETCYSPTNSFDIDCDLFGPYHLPGNFDSYINSSDGSAKGGFDQACITAADNDVNYNNYQSVIFVMQSWNTTDAGGNPIERSAWGWAWGGTYTTAEGSKTLAVLMMSHNWSAKPIYATLAHELGHNMGLGDQYAKDDYSRAVNARTLGAWETMADENPLPHFTLPHRMMLGWIRPAWIKLYNFAQNGGAPVNETVTLQAVENCPPTAGRYAGIEIRIADGWNYYLEYRKGQGAHIGDKQLPRDSVVLMTDVISTGYAAPLTRPYILRGMDDSVLTNGDSYSETDFTDPTYPTDFKISVSGIDGVKADVKIEYGVNSKPDPSIREWPASATRQYQSPDIEVQNARSLVNPDWFNVPWTGHENTVIAQVKNAGNLDAPGVRANFYVKDYTIGGAPETPLDPDTHDVNALDTVAFRTVWMPAPGEHYCIIVRIPLYQLLANPAVVEMTERNNFAQSNYDRFISATASAASREITTVTVGNPYPKATRIYIIPNQTNPLYRTYLEHTTVYLDPGATCKLKLMFEYDPKVILSVPVSVGDQTVDDQNRGLGEEMIKEFQPRPNRARFAGFIEDPLDPQRDAPVFLGGAEVEVVTGRKTQFAEFAYDAPYVTGMVVTVDDKQHVSGGHVIVILMLSDRHREWERCETVAVNSQGTFKYNLSEIKDRLLSVQGYYVPPAGYGDCYSEVIKVS